MTVKNTKAKQKYWKKFSAEERSKMMSLRVKKGWKKKTKAEKFEKAMRMVEARKSYQQANASKLT